MKTLLVISALFCLGCIALYNYDHVVAPYEVPAADVTGADEWKPYPAK